MSQQGPETGVDTLINSAPWTAKESCDEVWFPDNAAVTDTDGHLVAEVEPRPTCEPAWERARLIAAAGTAAQEAKGMGYDPQKAVEALPELLRMIENAAIDLTDLRAFVAQNERHNIKTTRSARRVLQKALAKAGADETMIPGDDGEVDDALARAEGSQDE